MERRRSIGLGIAALAIVGVTGGIVGAQLTGGPESPREVRQVSDEGTVTPTVSASPSAALTKSGPTTGAKPTATASAASKKPAPKSSSSRTTNRSQTVPEDEPEPTQTEDAGPEQPAPGPPLPTIRRCYDNDGVEYPCPRN